jgi:hypothetical protein
MAGISARSGGHNAAPIKPSSSCANEQEAYLEKDLAYLGGLTLDLQVVNLTDKWSD